MYNVCQTTEFMTKFRERTMPSKFSSCDNALPSQYEPSTETCEVQKSPVTLFISYQCKHQNSRRGEMSLCKLKKKKRNKTKSSLEKVLVKKLHLKAQITGLLFTDSNVNLGIDRDL